MSHLQNCVCERDVNPRSRERKQALQAEAQARRAAGLVLPEEMRYRERTTVERVNCRLKDEFGGRTVRVRGHAKVRCTVSTVSPPPTATAPCATTMTSCRLPSSTLINARCSRSLPSSCAIATPTAASTTSKIAK